MSLMPYAPPACTQAIESSPVDKLKQSAAKPKIDAAETSVFLLSGIGLGVFFLISNLFALMDLFCGGIQVNEDIVPSPFIALEFSRTHLMIAYALFTAIVVLCGVVVARRDTPHMMGIIAMVPIIFIVYLVGISMRKSGPIGTCLAGFYLLAGSLLTGMAVIYFINTGMQLTHYETTPIMYSVCLQGGLILAISAAMSFEC